MPFQIVRADYAKIDCDAVVLSTSFEFRPMVDREGPDKRTTCEGGSQRLEARMSLGKIPAGTAKITSPGSYGMKARRIIYTVCPRKNDTNPKLSENKITYMKGCYRSCLEIAVREHLKSITFVLIGARNRGYDLETCLSVAISEILHFISDPDHPDHTEMTIVLTIFGSREFEEASRILREKYILPCIDVRMNNQDAGDLLKEEYASIRRRENQEEKVTQGENPAAESAPVSFREKLYEYFRNKGISEKDFYGMLQKNSICSRQTFYNMRQRPHYKPSKRIVLASAMALKLTLPETEELLSLAGYTFHPSDSIERQAMEYFDTLSFDHLDLFRKENFVSAEPAKRRTDSVKEKKWRYSRLSAYFKEEKETPLALTFSQIEDILGFNLPDSYRSNRTMWYPRAGLRTMSDAWTSHGYRLSRLDMKEGLAEFVKLSGKENETGSSPDGGSIKMLKYT